MMRRLKVFLLFVCLHLGTALPGVAQLPGEHWFSEMFFFPNFEMSLSNHFIVNGYKYSPQEITLPYVRDSFTCYGAVVNMSGFERDSVLDFNDTGALYRLADSTTGMKLFLHDLYVKVSRNDTVIRNGRIRDVALRVPDTRLTRHGKKPLTTPMLFFVHDSLQVGDHLLIELTRPDGSLVMRIGVRRKWAYNQPFLCGSSKDSALDPVEFVSRQMIKQAQYFDTQSYEDWPDSGLRMTDEQVPTYTNLAFYFRREVQHGTDSVYLVRLLRSDNPDTTWKKSNHRVLLPVLEPGVRYKLQAKYADGHGIVSSYRFHTPPLWYQAWWVKVLAMALVVALLLAGWLIYIARRNARRLKVQRLEMQSVYAQINPHFVFNALGSIQGLMNDGQIERANRYLTGFAALLRNTILQGKEEWVTLTAERKSMEQYLLLEQLRFGFNFMITASAALPENMPVPRLLTQPLIENAVKHGVRGLGSQGELSIRWSKDGRDVIFLLEDNGPGCNAAKAGIGQGLQLTRNRIALLNRMNGRRHITLSLANTKNGCSCTVLFKNWLPA